MPRLIGRRELLAGAGAAVLIGGLDGCAGRAASRLERPWPAESATLR